MADEVHNPPTELPRPTDQGDSGLCTRHAIGNTIASEGMKHKVDFNLDSAITALVQFESDRNVHTGINPLDFHKKVFVLQDKTSKFWYHVHLSVERCNTAQCQAGIGKDQYVLVYPPNPSQRGTHCVYVQNIEKTPWGDCFRCINSWGPHEETPLININSQRIEIYKVMIQLTVNRSQDVSESTDISALSMNLNERLHITGVIYLKKKSDYENFKTLHATKRLSCDADIPIHCPVSNHNDMSNLILIPTGFTNVIVEGDVHLKTTSDFSDIVAYQYGCDATVHCHVNATQDLSNISQLTGLKGRYTTIIKANISLQKRDDYVSLTKYYSGKVLWEGTVVCHVRNPGDISHLAILPVFQGTKINSIVKANISLQKRDDYVSLAKYYSAKVLWEGTVVCHVRNPGDISHLAILPVFQGTNINAIVKGDLHLQTKKEYDDLLACYSTNMFSWEVKILCHLQNVGDIAHLAILPNFTGTNCSVAIKGHVHLTLKNDYDTLIKLHSTFSVTINAIIICGSDNISTNIGEVSQLLPLLTKSTKLVIKGDINLTCKKDYDMLIKLHSACSLTINAIVTCGSDNISTNIGEVSQLLPLLTKTTKLVIKGDIRCAHKKDYDTMIKLHSACSITINAIVTCGSDNISTNIGEVFQLLPLLTKATKLIITGDISRTHNKDYDMLIKLHSACSVTINAIVTFGIDKNSTNLREVAQLVPIVTKATKLVIKGSSLMLSSPEDAQVFRQLSTTCRVTYTHLQYLGLDCDVSGWEVDWLDWLAELVSVVPRVSLHSAVKLNDNICGAVARRLEQPGAKLQVLRLLQCDMSLVSGAALADVWAKVSKVYLWTKLTEAQAVGVAGRLEGRDARMELLVLYSTTDVLGVSGGTLANLMRRVSRVKTYDGFSMTKKNVREMMGRLKQKGLSVDTEQLKMDTGWFWVAGPGEKVKLEITKDATGVKLSGS